MLILSHELWAQRFGANPHVLGRVLRLSGFDVMIGALSPGFQVLLKATSEIPPQMYYPLPCDPGAMSWNCQAVRLVGRRRSGVGRGEAAEDANAVFQRVARANPTAHLNGARLTVTPLRDVILGRESFGAVRGMGGRDACSPCSGNRSDDCAPTRLDGRRSRREIVRHYARRIATDNNE